MGAFGEGFRKFLDDVTEMTSGNLLTAFPSKLQVMPGEVRGAAMKKEDQVGVMVGEWGLTLIKRVRKSTQSRELPSPGTL